MPTEKSLKITLWLVAVGFFMQTLDTTIVNTAVPAMAASLGESPLRMQSVVISYSLTMALLIPASGWVADRFGTRPVFLAAIILFTIGSTLCALSQTLHQLVASRVLQGAGGAMLMPVGRLAVLRSFPRERLLPAMSFVAIPGLIGPLVGPSLGGFLAETLSWHWVFLINIPVGIALGICTWLSMADNREGVSAKFDFYGYLLLAFGMAAISLSLDGLSGRSTRHASVMLLLVFGLVAVAAYWLRAARRPGALFPPTLFRIHTFTIGLLGGLFARLGAGSMPYLIPLLLQVSLGYSPIQAGLMMLPVAAAGMVAKQIATPLIFRFGYRLVLIINTILLGTLIMGFALFNPAYSMWVLLVPMALYGAFNSLQYTAMNTLTLKDLEHSSASSGNSMMSMIQMLSMSMGVTIAGSILELFMRARDQGHPTESLSAFHATFVCVGLLTMASAWIFWQLSPDVPPSAKNSDTIELG